MNKRICGIILSLLLIFSLIFVFNVKPVASGSTIYIRADGSVDPPTAPIQRDGDIYTFIDNINDSIVVERDNIVVNGAHYTLQGTGAPESIGIRLSERNNVTIENMEITGNIYGVYAWPSSKITILKNNIRDCWFGIWLGYCSDNTIAYNNITSCSSDGIRIHDSSNNTILSNNITNNCVPVSISDSSNNSILSNNIIRSAYGVGLGSSDNNTIADNNIEASNGTGILLMESSNNNFILGNNVVNSQWCGIYLHYSSNNTLRNNVMINNSYNFGIMAGESNVSNFINDVDASNTVNGKPIYYWIGKRDMTVPLDAGYIALVNCTNITAQNLNLRNNEKGILLVSTKNSTIIQNNIADSENGVWLLLSSNNSIIDNMITTRRAGSAVTIFNSLSNSIIRNMLNDCYSAVDLYQSFGNTVLLNNITNNAFGILSFPSSNNSISKNDITNNTLGIGLYPSSNYNNISENNLANNIYGIDLSESSNNNIWENMIANSQYGIVFSGSSNNIICHNNFVNNTNQVGIDPYGYPSANVWDDGYPSGGNYWSNYTEVDIWSGPYQNETGSDGIGDTPYTIDENNRDNYPLMGTFGHLTREGENVTVFPSGDVNLIFESVTIEGYTTVNRTEVGPEPPSGFRLGEQYYDIETTANYSGKIKIRIIYDDSNMTQEEEALQLMQWNETSQEWIDITTYIDNHYNVIFGETSHLSTFALLTPAQLHVRQLIISGPHYTQFGIEYWIVELIEGKAARVVSNY